MSRHPVAEHGLAATLLTLIALAPTVPAHAAGAIQITHAKALAGNVTPGDAAGYPVTISIAGSFQLASNLIVPANQIGILIKRSFVTVDLNGFTMQGSGVATYGIQGTLNSATIKNGTITGFKSDGISGTGRFWSIEDMRVVGNGSSGILTGDGAHVRSSTSAGNGKDGVSCGNLCLVERSAGCPVMPKATWHPSTVFMASTSKTGLLWEIPFLAIAMSGSAAVALSLRSTETIS